MQGGCLIVARLLIPAPVKPAANAVLTPDIVHLHLQPKSGPAALYMALLHLHHQLLHITFSLLESLWLGYLQASVYAAQPDCTILWPPVLEVN